MFLQKGQDKISRFLTLSNQGFYLDHSLSPTYLSNARNNSNTKILIHLKFQPSIQKK